MPAGRRRLPALKPKQIAAALRKAGFKWGPSGRHRSMIHPKRPHKVSIPNPGSGAISPDSELFKSILRQAGLTKREFEDLHFGKKRSP